MSWIRIREIKLTADTQNSIAEYQRGFARFNDVWHGLTWLLARNPEPIGLCYEFGTENGTRYFHSGTHGDFVAEIPDVWVVYSYTEHELTVHDVYACETSPDDDLEEEEG
jgi:hypothetical protein